MRSARRRREGSSRADAGGSVRLRTPFPRNQDIQGLMAVVAVLVCVGVLLIIAISLLSLMPERYKQQVGWKAVAGLLLGGFALAVPWAIAYRARM